MVINQAWLFFRSTISVWGYLNRHVLSFAHGMSTRALDLIAKRNALRTRNRDLTGLTAESSPPPFPKRRARAKSLPMALKIFSR